MRGNEIKQGKAKIKLKRKTHGYMLVLKEVVVSIDLRPP